jgi:hypothetical protein
MQLISHPPQEYALDRSPNIVFTHQWWQLWQQDYQEVPWCR